MSSLVLPSRDLHSDDNACLLTTGDYQTQNFSTQNSSIEQMLTDNHQSDQCTAVSVIPAGRLTSSFAAARGDDDGAGDVTHTQRIPDSVWSEFTETFRVIELAVSEGLRCSIDAPSTAFQPELELPTDLPPVDLDNRHQYALQVTRRDVTSARRQCEYDVTCAAVARRRDGDDVRYAVSYNRWITVARQPTPAGVARQPTVYESNSKQTYDDVNATSDDFKLKPKDECLWGGCGASDASDSWFPAAWPPSVKQEQMEERPSCAYQPRRDDADYRDPTRFRHAVPNEFKDCRYATVSYNKVQKIFSF